MSCLSWNCRGLGNPLAVLALRELVKTHKPGLVFLFETLAHHNKIEEVRRSIGFNGCFSVDKIGRSEGVAIL